MTVAAKSKGLLKVHIDLKLEDKFKAVSENLTPLYTDNNYNNNDMISITIPNG